MPTIQFPAHTQARMDAARASKKAAEKPLVTMPEIIAEKKPVLAPRSFPHGHVIGLSTSARRKILKSPTRVVIAYGSRENPLALMVDANLAILRYYAPEIVDKYHTTTAHFGATIMLPDEMELVTARGLNYVVSNMLREICQGSYYSKWWSKDDKDTGTYMIRPRSNPVDMIHALNTLRAFGMEKDAEFLVIKNGPIAVHLEKRAHEMVKSRERLQRYLMTLAEELLEEQDRHVLDAAWKVYHDSLPTEASHKDPKE